jgi:hypothetical protein
MKTNIHFQSYLAHLFLELEMLRAEFIKKIKTHFMFNNFFFSKNRAVCDTMWKNMVEADRLHMTTWLMLSAFWIPKATNTLSEYVILIAFPH